MSKSINPTHDIIHVKNVEHHALSIWKEFKANSSRLVDKEEVLLAVWWHDVFKAKYRDTNILQNLFEGVGSAFLLLKYSKKNNINFKQIKNSFIAILVHNNPFAIYMSSFIGNGIIRILMEADGIDGFRLERVKTSFMKLKSPIEKKKFLFIQTVLRCIMKLDARSSYAKGILSKQKCKLN